MSTAVMLKSFIISQGREAQNILKSLQPEEQFNYKSGAQEVALRHSPKAQP